MAVSSFFDYVSSSLMSNKICIVLAQELAQQMPNAVQVAGDVVIDDVTFPNFLVVNERTLLFESILHSIFYSLLQYLRPTV